MQASMSATVGYGERTASLLMHLAASKFEYLASIWLSSPKYEYTDADVDSWPVPDDLAGELAKDTRATVQARVRQIHKLRPKHWRRVAWIP